MEGLDSFNLKRKIELTRIQASLLDMRRHDKSVDVDIYEEETVKLLIQKGFRIFRHIPEKYAGAPNTLIVLHDISLADPKVTNRLTAKHHPVLLENGKLIGFEVPSASI